MYEYPPRYHKQSKASRYLGSEEDLNLNLYSLQETTHHLANDTTPTLPFSILRPIRAIRSQYHVCENGDTLQAPAEGSCLKPKA